MTETKIDAFMRFPVDEHSEGTLDRLVKLCDSIENVEEWFGIEFACGPNKYFSDFFSWSDNGEGMHANASTEEMEEYDGKVDLVTPPRLVETKEQLKTNKDYRFTIKVINRGDYDEVTFCLDGKKQNSQQIVV